MGLIFTAAATAGALGIYSWIKKRDALQKGADPSDAPEGKFSGLDEFLARLLKKGADAANAPDGNVGEGSLPEEDRQILAMWEEAAQKGDPQAQFNLGNMYYIGEAVPQDYAKAFFWYENAAARGHAEAQARLGSMYHLGQSVPRDLAKAREWWEKAAAQGDGQARSMLVIYR